MNKQRKWNRLQGIAAIAGVLLLALAAVDFLPAVNALLKSGDEQAIQLYFRALGLKGVLFLILLQMVQVITSLIPALSLQAAAGASYGPLFGRSSFWRGWFWAMALSICLRKNYLLSCRRNQRFRGCWSVSITGWREKIKNSFVS